MWVSKFIAYDSSSLINNLVKKYRLTISYYPVNHYKKGSQYFFIAVGEAHGEKENIKEFFKELKSFKSFVQNKRIVSKLEVNGNFFVMVTSEKESSNLNTMVSLFYNPEIVHIKPAIIDENGYETWEIGCIDRTLLEKMLHVARVKYHCDVKKIRNEKIDNFGTIAMLPSLTDKQYNAIALAVKEGYYEVPRKVFLEKLAEMSKLAISTYEVHLRKAEKKLIPFVVKRCRPEKEQKG